MSPRRGRRGALVLMCPSCRGKRRGRRAVGHPVCAGCWALVPEPVQIAVRRAWDRLGRDASPAAFLAYAREAARAQDTAAVVRELSRPGSQDRVVP